MSYDLYNPSTQIARKLTDQFWAKALELAQHYGWQPQETQHLPCFDSYSLQTDWHGGYLTNDGQTVIAEDALSLAAALEKSLGDIPDDNPPIDCIAELWLENDLPEWLSPEERELIQEGLETECLDVMGTQPSEFFAGCEKDMLIMLIRFCRLGSFILA
ncbi:MAG: hypothetical protein AB1649_27450 [Chloroflexota bacterium]